MKEEIDEVGEIMKKLARLHLIEEIAFPFVVALAAAVSLIIIFGVLS